MCIIAHSPIGKPIPSIEYIRNMFNNNPDGAGYAYVQNGLVRWHKGFMDVESLLESIKSLSNNVNLTDVDFIMHCRIGTHGGNTAENTHPFIISRSYDDMKKLNGRTKLGVVFHNGVINSVTVPNGVSDTMAWVRDRFSLLYTYDHKCIYNPIIQDMISIDIGSKLAVMTPKGVIRIGSWVEGMDGNFYSNSTYSYCYKNKSGKKYGAYYDDDDYVTGIYDTGYRGYSNKKEAYFYKVVCKEKGKLWLDTMSDYYDINDVDMDLYYGTNNRIYSVIIDEGAEIIEPVSANIVDAGGNAMTFSRMSKEKYLKYGDFMTVDEDDLVTSTYKQNEHGTERISVTPTLCIKLESGKDELWDMMNHRYYSITSNERVVLSEGEEVFVYDKSRGKYVYTTLTAAHLSVNGKYVISTFGELYNERQACYLSEFEYT